MPLNIEIEIEMMPFGVRLVGPYSRMAIAIRWPEP